MLVRLGRVFFWSLVPLAPIALNHYYWRPTFGGFDPPGSFGGSLFLLLIIATLASNHRLIPILSGLVAYCLEAGPVIYDWIRGESLDTRAILPYWWLVVVGAALGLGTYLRYRFRVQSQGLYLAYFLISGIIVAYPLISPLHRQLAKEVTGPIPSRSIIGQHYIPGQPARFDISLSNASDHPVEVAEVTIRSGSASLCKLEGPARIAPGKLASYGTEFTKCPIPSYLQVVAIHVAYADVDSGRKYVTVLNTFPPRDH